MAQYYGYDNGNGGGGFLSSIPVVTRNILIINVIMFLATLANESFMIKTFAMFYPESPFFRIWQPVTYMFMHGGFAHIFFNMFALFMFGIPLEKTIGSKKFLIFYFVTGLGALLIHTGVEFIQVQMWESAYAAGEASAQTSYLNMLRTPVLGASGAIYGIQIGFAMLYPNSVWTLIFPPISLKAKWFVLIFVVIELVTGITGTAEGVAHFAHLGGMLFGWLLILYWKKKGTLFQY